jgi:hypothetical protein
MKLPDQVKDIIGRFVAKFPLWSMTEGPGAEEQARQWSIHLAEQIAFEVPGQGWGKKRADPGRPISKDAIAQLGEHVDPPQPGKLFAYDILTGAGTGKPGLVSDPDSIDITGQTFVSVTPTNHLGVVVEPKPKPPAPVPIQTPEQVAIADTLRGIVQRLEDIQARFDVLILSMDEQVTPPTVNLSPIIAKLDRVLTNQNRAYVGAVAMRLRLTPEEVPAKKAP